MMFLGKILFDSCLCITHLVALILEHDCPCASNSGAQSTEMSGTKQADLHEVTHFANHP